MRKEYTHELNDYITMVATMIRTGASEDAIDDFIYNLYVNEKVTERGYSLLMGMNYR